MGRLLVTFTFLLYTSKESYTSYGTISGSTADPYSFSTNPAFSKKFEMDLVPEDQNALIY
jgi:hypothetical protein